jgi:hypothetical protein
MKYNIELIRLIAVVLITFTHTRHHLESGVLFFIVESVPKVGTLLLSIISGYLYWTISRTKTNLLQKKIKSLLIPYLISNILIIVIAVGLYVFFNINFLNRLSYDFSLITEGLLSLHVPPINPPTYFIRDIFVVFLMIDLLKNKNLKTLLFLIPILIFGKLLIRVDILLLFILGTATPFILNKFNKKALYILFVFASLLIYIYLPEYIKYPLAYLIFVLVIDINIKFVKTGGYSYILHLYHAPLMMLIYPFLASHNLNDPLSILLQIIFAIVMTFVIYLITRKIKFLQIISGGR